MKRMPWLTQFGCLLLGVLIFADTAQSNCERTITRMVSGGRWTSCVIHMKWIPAASMAADNFHTVAPPFGSPTAAGSPTANPPPNENPAAKKFEGGVSWVSFSQTLGLSVKGSGPVTFQPRPSLPVPSNPFPRAWAIFSAKSYASVSSGLYRISTLQGATPLSLSTNFFASIPNARGRVLASAKSANALACLILPSSASACFSTAATFFWASVASASDRIAEFSASLEKRDARFADISASFADSPVFSSMTPFMYPILLSSRFNFTSYQHSPNTPTNISTQPIAPKMVARGGIGESINLMFRNIFQALPHSCLISHHSNAMPRKTTNEEETRSMKSHVLCLSTISLATYPSETIESDEVLKTEAVLNRHEHKAVDVAQKAMIVVCVVVFLLQIKRRLMWHNPSRHPVCPSQQNSLPKKNKTAKESS